VLWLDTDEQLEVILTNGFVIGNGTSREGFDLSWLRGRGISIGCNYIWHDFMPDYVVTIDEEPVRKTQAYLAHNPGSFRHVYREMVHEPGERWGRNYLCDGEITIKAKYLNDGINNNSGVAAAAYLAEVLNCDTIYLIGIDFFRQTDEGRNDIYCGRICYSQGIVDAWNHLFAKNHDRKFVRVGPIAERDESFYENDLFELWLCDSFEEFQHHVDTRRCKDANRHGESSVPGV